MIKLYYGTEQKEWRLQADKLFAIEDIESYLSNFDYVAFSSFQYIKNKLNLNIKVDLSQSYSQPLYTNGIRYVAVSNVGENTYYYYVKNVEWTSKSTINLTLVMDILNTFKYGIDYKLNKKTKIKREHKDRFVLQKSLYLENCELIGDSFEFDTGHIVKITSDSFEGEITGKLYTYIVDYGSSIVEDLEVILDAESIAPALLENATIIISYDDEYSEIKLTGTFSYNNSSLYRKVDYLSEGINAPLYKEDEDKYVEREAPLNKDWYLVYRNQNEPTESLINPVECYLIPATETPVNVGSITAGGRITAENLESDKYYYFSFYGNTSSPNTNKITLSTGDIFQVNQQSTSQYYAIAYKNDEDKITFVYVDASTHNTSFNKVVSITTCSFFDISPLPFYYGKKTTLELNLTNVESVLGLSYSWTSEGTTPLTIDGINLLDRTEAKTFKVIKLPYIPSNFSIEGGRLVLTGSEWEHITLEQANGSNLHCLKLKDLNTKFNYSFKSNLISPMADLVINDTTIPYNDERNDFYESKIFHSDFFQPKLSYDSFGYVFSLERLNLDKFISLVDKTHMNIQYVVTTTINSRFMFIYTDYVADTLGKEDYNNVMPIARNNDITLYNVPYINYIRNGYNYEVKSKNRNIGSNIAGFGLSTGATLLSWALTPAPIKIPAVIMGVTSMITSLKSTITTTAQAEQDMEAKQVSLKNQSTSVEGSDDIDLMSVYAKNRLKYTCYKVSPVMKKLLLDLFYYTGYNSNRLAVPNIKTRVWFNYIECEPLFDKTINMSSDIIEELSSLFKTGITFIHKVNNTWDIEQVKENAERSIVGM